MFRTLLIIIVLFIATRYVIKLFRPSKRNPNENIYGAPQEPPRTIDKNRIEDAKFKDIPEK